MTLKHHIFFQIVIIILMGGNPISAQENAVANEYALKADFLYRFVDYVYWKDYSKKQTFKIAILEESPITASLLNFSKNKKIEVKEYKNLNEISFCNILFVPYNCTDSNRNNFIKIFRKTRIDCNRTKWLWKKRGTHEFCFS